jgi:hypothetical protein
MWVRLFAAATGFLKEEQTHERFPSQRFDDFHLGRARHRGNIFDPLAGTVAMPSNIYDASPRTRDLALFFLDVETDFVARAAKFLRDELGCKALLTNCNSWTDPLCMQLARQNYDYVDTHFYVDHPGFLERPWSLPSRSPNTVPFKSKEHGGKHNAFLRLIDKPFTVSEFNYSGPGRFRGLGGLMTGALAALQDWSAMWRFCYSHSRESLLEPRPINYFDMACDPLGQASERATLLLFLRGDMQPGRNVLIVPASEADWKGPTMPWADPEWGWAAWVTRVASQIPSSKKYAGTQAVTSINAKADEVMALLRTKLDAGQTSDLGKTYFRSQTGELTVDGPQDAVLIDTERTAGGYAPAGKTIQTSRGLSITMQDSDATVWISALDGQPIMKSARLLLTHLTDLQNTGVKYAESARQTLLEWGRLPHLVRAGKARIELKHEQAAKLKVWALSPAGKRLAEAPVQVENGAIILTVDVAADANSGARMIYEIGVR